MVVRRATLLAKDDWITTGEIDIPDKGRQPGEYSLNDERMERATILKALEATGNDRKAAARLLGISRSTLYLKLKKYRLIRICRNSDTSCPIHNTLCTIILLLSIWFISNVLSVYSMFQAWHLSLFRQDEWNSFNF